MKPPVYHRMFGYDTDILPNRHLASLEQGVKTIDEARARTGATIGQPGWGFIYHLLLSHLDRSREEIIIETGTNFGCTSIILAQALIDTGCKGNVLTFELDENNVEVAKTNFEKAEVDSRIEIRCGDSKITLPEFVKDVDSIRFAYLDASHLYEDVLFEFESLLPVLSDDAIVLFDNTYRIADPEEDQRVNGALKTIKELHGGNLINLESVSWFTPGLAIWQKNLLL